MTRKDFNLIAIAVSNVASNNGADRLTINAVTEALADALTLTNDHFPTCERIEAIN